MKGLVPILTVKSDWKATNPPLIPTISPNTSNQNIEIGILFNVIENSGYCVFEDDKPIKLLRARVVSYALGHIRFL
jgi:hypothetical protein